MNKDFLLNAALVELISLAGNIRDRGKSDLVSYSRKVFIPLTELCRDVCHYCTFAKTPRHLSSAYLSPERVLDIARQGCAQGCKEALFTLGDKPELRYAAARESLAALGYASTLEYLNSVAELVLRETGLLPHLNPGVLTLEDYRRLRPIAPSMGLMLESASSRLCERGGPHFGSPDKDPVLRLASIAAAGQVGVPLTTGILIGIGETREERVDSLVALRELHERYGHIQEIIIQNFVPKPGTVMAGVDAPDGDELLWTVAVARCLFGAGMNIQVPPNLNPGLLSALISAGINDWGGVSPVTPDHVNPESPWPQIEALERQTAASGKTLVERLTIYPEYVCEPEKWIHPELVPHILRHSDSEGFARSDKWSPGLSASVPFSVGGARPVRAASVELSDILRRARAGERLRENDVSRLFSARGSEFEEVCECADALRRESSGDDVTFVINRNINYTNLCVYKCQFCAFSKGKVADDLRGSPYVLDLDEIARRTEEAWNRGATEVCLQGGIHPAFTGETYLDICRAVKQAAPGIHVHAFSPLEIMHGAQTLGVSIVAFLSRLIEAGLASLPGTAAEILDDDVRRVICPDKLTSAEWLDVVGAAHSLGLRTTSTIMFGHIDTAQHWARHLLALRDLQECTGGLTEFVPLPFVHMEAPLFRRGRARPGPTYRETILMHAVGRLALHPLVTNIQTSWVKMGTDGVGDCLAAGANDLGGTLMNESISRAAGADHGEELSPTRMRALVERLGRRSRQRTTLYGTPDPEQIKLSDCVPPLAALRYQPARAYRARG